MKEIQITQGKLALVDDEDYEWINQWSWYFHNGYAKRMSPRGFITRKKIYMHREIMKTPMGMETDHINGNGLDNGRKSI